MAQGGHASFSPPHIFPVPAVTRPSPTQHLYLPFLQPTAPGLPSTPPSKTPGKCLCWPDPGIRMPKTLLLADWLLWSLGLALSFRQGWAFLWLLGSSASIQRADHFAPSRGLHSWPGCSLSIETLKGLPWWSKVQESVQDTGVPSLIQEDPTYSAAIKPACHNYWASTLEPTSHNHWAHTLPSLKPAHLRACAPQRSHCNEKPVNCNKEQPHSLQPEEVLGPQRSFPPPPPATAKKQNK